jgi:hypothetical protein
VVEIVGDKPKPQSHCEFAGLGHDLTQVLRHLDARVRSFVSRPSVFGVKASRLVTCVIDRS